MSVCMCEQACERERERERKLDGDSERERKRETKRLCVWCLWVSVCGLWVSVCGVCVCVCVCVRVCGQLLLSHVRNEIRRQLPGPRAAEGPARTALSARGTGR